VLAFGVSAVLGFLLVVDLVQRLLGLAVPFPEFVLEVGHVGLVVELVQVVERLRGCMLSDALGTRRIELACLVGALCDQASHVRDEALGCLDILGTSFSAAPDLDAAIKRYSVLRFRQMLDLLHCVAGQARHASPREGVVQHQLEHLVLQTTFLRSSAIHRE
jgi:hypothetical protein